MKQLALWTVCLAGCLVLGRDLALAARHKTLYPKPTTIRPRKAKKLKWQMREDVRA